MFYPFSIKAWIDIQVFGLDPHRKWERRGVGVNRARIQSCRGRDQHGESFMYIFTQSSCDRTLTQQRDRNKASAQLIHSLWVCGSSRAVSRVQIKKIYTHLYASFKNKRNFTALEMCRLIQFLYSGTLLSGRAVDLSLCHIFTVWVWEEHAEGQKTGLKIY